MHAVWKRRVSRSGRTRRTSSRSQPMRTVARARAAQTSRGCLAAAQPSVQSCVAAMHHGAAIVRGALLRAPSRAETPGPPRAPVPHIPSRDWRTAAKSPTRDRAKRGAAPRRQAGRRPAAAIAWTVSGPASPGAARSRSRMLGRNEARHYPPALPPHHHNNVSHSGKRRLTAISLHSVRAKDQWSAACAPVAPAPVRPHETPTTTGGRGRHDPGAASTLARRLPGCSAWPVRHLTSRNLKTCCKVPDTVRRRRPPRRRHLRVAAWAHPPRAGGVSAREH